jgi:hypothetical protein
MKSDNGEFYEELFYHYNIYLDHTLYQKVYAFLHILVNIHFREKCFEKNM